MIVKERDSALFPVWMKEPVKFHERAEKEAIFFTLDQRHEIIESELLT